MEAISSFLKARDKHTSQVASELVAVILTRGVGELTFTIFYGKSQRPAAPPEFTWESRRLCPSVAGHHFIELREHTLEAGSVGFFFLDPSPVL